MKLDYKIKDAIENGIFKLYLIKIL